MDDVKPTIFIVDDTPDNLSFVAGLLKNIYNIKVANSGKKLLDYLVSNSVPDLILLDVIMPDLSGYDVLLKLKENKKTKEIPVVFLSAMSGEEERQKGLDMGAVDYLVKPIDGSSLLGCIDKQLAKTNKKDGFIMKTFVALFLLPIFLFASINTSLTQEEEEWLQNQKEIRVGAMEAWAPFDFLNYKGEPSGIGADIINALNIRLNGKLKIVSGSWSDIYEKTKKGEFHAILDITEKEERKDFFYFTQSYLQVPHVIVSRKSSPRIGSLKELKGKKVGLEKNIGTIFDLQKNFPSVAIQTYTNTSHCLDALSRGEVDAYVGNRAVVTYLIAKEMLDNLKIDALDTTRQNSPLALGISKQYPILNAILQKKMDEISGGELGEILASWSVGKSSKIDLSEEEFAWLNAHPVIRFTADPHHLPFGGFEEDGDYVGIVADHLKILEERLGVAFVKVPSSSLSEALDKAKKGDVDIVSNHIADQTLKHTHVTTKPYIKSPLVIVTRKDKRDYFITDLSELKRDVIAVMKEYGYLSQVYKQYPELKFVEVQNVQEAMAGVASGEYDAMLASLTLATYTIGKMGLYNVHIAGKTDTVMELGIGVRKDWEIFAKILEKGLDSITQEESKNITQSWISIESKSSVDYDLILKIVGVFLFVLFVLFYWNYELKKQVAKKTAELKAFNLKLESIVEARTRELAFLNEEQQAIFDSASVGIALLKNGVIVQCNRRMDEIFGYEQSEQLHKNADIWFPNKSDLSQICENIWYSKTSIWEQQFLRKDGSMFWGRISCRAINIEKKENGVVSVVEDITGEIQAMEDINRAKILAEETTKIKSDFLANMSHEIRTPMNVIIGMSNLALQGELNPKQKNYIEKVNAASKNLLRIINDILDFSKIEAGKMTFENIDFYLEEVMEHLSDICVMKAQEKGLELLFDVGCDVPTGLKGDPLRLSQVLINLLNNAIKFTEAGEVRLGIHLVSQDKNFVTLHFEIKDTGIGMSKEHLEKIFQAFSQADISTTRKYGGSGLGLAISKHLIGMMQGNIGVSSELGKGKYFLF
ncbi:MAG: transporter substrate-binding domain-containing protein [Sulfurospirillaceae bacterium]|nr:transporter substrate-binding domain-containing protein [Sulfurospirillaceae bacterium]